MIVIGRRTDRQKRFKLLLNDKMTRMCGLMDERREGGMEGRSRHISNNVEEDNNTNDKSDNNTDTKPKTK